jgi:hypothetical protein
VRKMSRKYCKCSPHVSVAGRNSGINTVLKLPLSSYVDYVNSVDMLRFVTVLVLVVGL